MHLLAKGKYRVRLAQGGGDLTKAQALRHRSFLSRRGLAADLGLDADGFDSACLHVLVEEAASATLVGCYRLLPLEASPQITQSYSAQFYDLSALAQYPGALLEMGRFCLHPDWHDPDILRLAWGAMTRIVDERGVKLLFGCSSFEGGDPAMHHQSLRQLRGHIAPVQWRPGRKAAEVYPLVLGPETELRTPQSAMPPLLRTYLGMGGWVSDHAVVDRMLDTLHVFTAVEIDRIPATRARLLRAIAD